MTDVYDIANDVIEMFEAKGINDTEALSALGILAGGFLAQRSLEEGESWCAAVMELVKKSDEIVAPRH